MSNLWYLDVVKVKKKNISRGVIDSSRKVLPAWTETLVEVIHQVRGEYVLSALAQILHSTTDLVKRDAGDLVHGSLPRNVKLDQSLLHILANILGMRYFADANNVWITE